MVTEPSQAKDREYVERSLSSVVVQSMSQARVVAVLGARQAGKSTLVKELAERELGAEYISLDDPDTLSLAVNDPIGLLGSMARPAIIDEIQRAPNLLLSIKSQVDQDNARGQFLITGSANLRAIPTVPDALPGRIDYLTLWPFTQGELTGGRDRFLDLLFDGEVPTSEGSPLGRDAYAEMLLKGGFPEAQHRPAKDRRRFFESYVQSITERDVPETSRIHDSSAVGELLRLIAARSGSIARYERLGRDLKMDGKTAKSYVQVLDRLFLIRIRRAWHRNLGKRHVKAPKLYVADTGLLAELVGIDSGRVKADGGIAGALFETFVANELERQASWSEEPCTFWHLREREREVDVIAERRNGDIVGVEVKAAATVTYGDFAGLAWLRDQFGPRFRAGVVLHTGQEPRPFGNRLWALPLDTLWKSGS